MTKFYYNQYKFRDDKKYLVYFRGNFSIPTCGHYSLLRQYIDLPQVKYFISQIGDERRHGVPYKISRKIWKLYIEELCTEEEKERIILQKLDSALDVLNHIEDIDRVIFLRGKEFSDEEKYEKEGQYLSNFSHLIKHLKYRNIGLDFLFIDRNEKDVLSTSKLIERLKYCRDFRRGNDYYSDGKLIYFFPKLSERSIYHILRILKHLPNLK